MSSQIQVADAIRYGNTVLAIVVLVFCFACGHAMQVLHRPHQMLRFTGLGLISASIGYGGTAGQGRPPLWPGLIAASLGLIVSGFGLWGMYNGKGRD